MADHNDQSSSRSRRTSTTTEPLTSMETTTNPTITLLMNGNPLHDSNTINIPKDDSQQQRTRRRSSLSIIQALVNTSHLLSTHDARKR